jgi:bacterioferritin-associated ferredoxin
MKWLIDIHQLSSYEELKSCMVFGENCKMCVPYVKKMIATGDIFFEVMSSEEARDLSD